MVSVLCVRSAAFGFKVLFFLFWWIAESLENRIAHFAKKRRISIHYNDDDGEDDETMVRGKRQHGWANNKEEGVEKVAASSTSTTSSADGESF